MSRPVVFVDTNSVDNQGSATKFLGGRADLEKISKRANVALPRIVYEELCRHIKFFLKNQKNSFKSNPHRHMLGIDDVTIDQLDHEKLLEKLLDEESIKFEIIDLSDELTAYREALVHSLEGSPPFEPKGDKGFKDTMIAKTIDQYALQNPDQDIFLLSSDIKLKEYFTGSKVSVISGFQEFDSKYSEDRMQEDLLLNRIWDFIDEENLNLSSKRKPDDEWLNSEGDNVVQFIEEESGNILLLVDSVAREPVSYISENPKQILENLHAVASFQQAHTAVAEFDYIYQYFSLDQIIAAANSIIANSQIYGIGGDEDIAQFAARLFASLDSNGEEGLATQIRSRFDLKLLTQRELVEIPF